MKLSFYTFLYVVLLLFASCKSTIIMAQPEASKKALEYYNKAEEAMAFGKLAQAEDYYFQAVSEDPNFIKARWKLADLYQFNDKAIEQYEAVLKIDNSWHKAYFYIANCYFLSQQYDKALKKIDQYTSFNIESAQAKSNAELLKKSILFAENAYKNPVPFTPVNLGTGVNSDKMEYFPSVTADNMWLYFTVNQSNNAFSNEDIYVSKFENGAWQPRVSLANINTSDGDEGAHCITQDGRYLFFASNRHDFDNQGQFDIYIAKKIGDDWKKPANIGLPFNTRYWESQPMITADSKALYFVRADAKDGFGNSDIYVSYIKEGKFQEPINLGSTINTPGEEQRPYLHPDGKTLYFSSDGHPGMGRSDLFKSEMQDDGTWSTPVNLGYPINSPENEFGLYVSADGKTGYISSEREGGYGTSDLYSFELPESAQPKQVLSVKGIVFDAISKAPIKASIQIINIKNGAVFKSLSSDEKNGEFLISMPAGEDYIFQVNENGYLPFSENFSLKNVHESDLILLEAPLQKIEKGKEFVLRNIFFDSGKFDLKEESKTELQTLINYLNQYPEIKIEIGGHTDSDGSDEANLKLSENRAKAVYSYLTSQGIHAERLSYKGYGESNPLEENTSSENKAKNRRTAFKVF